MEPRYPQRREGEVNIGNHPPYDMTIFKKYLQYTYMACGQVGGVEAPDVANIGLLVLAADIQRHEPRAFDFASYLVDGLHELERKSKQAFQALFIVNAYYFILWEI